jgi:transporter family-2 protein
MILSIQAAALGTGGLLSLMVLCNAEMARHGGALLSSLVAHGTGTAAAALMLLALARGMPGGAALGRGAPLWAYAGGLSGAVTVMLSSAAANTSLALAGTLALGLVGQAAFGLAADRWGFLGLPRRRPTPRDLLSLALVLAGSGLVILGSA